jgi:hypothetical protein
MSAPGFATATVEVHHDVPRCLLRLRDRAEAAGLTGEGIELAMVFEHEARRRGVNPDISRGDLAALVDASTVEIPGDEHRQTHAEDLRRWERITADELAAAFATIAGRS